MIVVNELNENKAKKSLEVIEAFFIKWRVHLAILTPSSPGTTFAASELDFQVRDVTGYFLTAIDTPKLYFNLGLIFLQSQNKISKTDFEPCSYHANKLLSSDRETKKIKQNGLLVLVSSTTYIAYTPNLSSS